MSRDGNLPAKTIDQQKSLHIFKHVPPISRVETPPPQPSQAFPELPAESEQQLKKSPSLQPKLSPKAAKPALPPFAENCENKYGRYVPNSLIISHLLIDNEGRALQFSIPATHVPEIPVVKALVSDVCGYKLPDGNMVFHGKTEDGIDMISSRSYQLSFQEGEQTAVDYTFYPLSPLKAKRLPSESSYIKRLKDSPEAKEIIENTEVYGKHGHINVVNTDISIRAETTRVPDQNTVMGRWLLKEPKPMSAVDVFKDVLNKYSHILSEEAKEFLEMAAYTPHRGGSILEAQLRPEHLHLLAWGLYPMLIDEKNSHLTKEEDKTPQRSSNLGAAGRWVNSAMMMPEDTAKNAIRRHPTAKVRIAGSFTMLLDTEVINTVNYLMEIIKDDLKMKFNLKMDCFNKDPQFVKPSDMATIVEIHDHFVEKKAPLSVQDVAVSSTPAINRFTNNFFKPKPNQAQQNRKRAREEVVVYPATEAPAEVKAPTPFLFSRQQQREILLDDDVIVLMNQLVDAQTSGAARAHP